MAPRRIRLPEFRVGDDVTPFTDEVSGPWHLNALGIQGFHQLGLRGGGITIGVVDTGVAPHQGLDPGQIKVADVLGTNGLDSNGHGTAMIGILIGDQGPIAPDSRILSVKAVGPSGTTSSNSLVRGMAAALDGGADILSVSVADTQASQELVDLVQQATAAGKVIIAAAGNKRGRWTVAFPASLPPVTAATALDEDGTLVYDAPAQWVDVAAPGQGIFTTVLQDMYAPVEGTSSATAVIAGVCALLLGMVPVAQRPALGRALPAILKRMGDLFPGEEPGTCVRLNPLNVARFIQSHPGPGPAIS